MWNLAQREEGMGGGFAARLAFALTVALIIFTALLHAILPDGLPLTRAIGSAFNPATPDVALRQEAAQITHAALDQLSPEPDPRPSVVQVLPGRPVFGGHVLMVLALFLLCSAASAFCPRRAARAALTAAHADPASCPTGPPIPRLAR